MPVVPAARHPDRAPGRQRLHRPLGAQTPFERDDRDAFQGWLIVTILLGLAFLGGQAYEYTNLIVNEDFAITSGIYGTVFFSLTGLHGLHVTVGVLAAHRRAHSRVHGPLLVAQPLRCRTGRSCTGTSSTSSGWRCTSPSTFFEFQTDPLLLVPLIGIGLAYLVGYRRLARRRRAQSCPTFAREPGCSRSATPRSSIALISPLHSVGEQYFSVHMVQHLLLTLVAPPLLLLSSSMPVLLWALPRHDRATLGRLVGQPGPVRTHPALVHAIR